MKNCEFVRDVRLGIELPRLLADWEDIAEGERAEIVAYWEHIRGRIPDRIRELERSIQEMQRLLGEEEDFRRSCVLNAEIAELAGRINELNQWFRVDPNVDADNSRV
jgi:hypothetical protein